MLDFWEIAQRIDGRDAGSIRDAFLTIRRKEGDLSDRECLILYLRRRLPQRGKDRPNLRSLPGGDYFGMTDRDLLKHFDLDPIPERSRK